MQETLKKPGMLLIGAIVALIVIAVLYGRMQTAPVVVSFEDCVAKGYEVLEIYPRKCKAPSGETFDEYIGNEIDKEDKIRIESPRPNALIAGSPLEVRGVARGTWYFEASFPVEIRNSKNEIIGIGHAEAQSEWMTTEFVPFKASIAFDAKGETRGTLILRKDNPSGLPEHDDALVLPIRFEKVIVGDPPKACVVSGCSAQICSDEPMMSTCEYRPEYMCYKTAKCERQTTGLCGWTPTKELQACLANPGSVE